MAGRISSASLEAVRRMVAWYFQHAFGRWEGPGQVPFYCDPSRVGHFSVTSEELAAGSESGLFRLFIGLAMYQARRDVVIMDQQRRYSAEQVGTMASLTCLSRRLQGSRCSLLSKADQLERECSIEKVAGRVTCRHRPRSACVVKDATGLFNRMADMGIMPASAYLRIWQPGGLRQVLEDVLMGHADPCRRAELLVERLGKVYRVGRKLASLYVSALSTPALAPGMTPWYPQVNGYSLTVIDTNVARVVDALAGVGATYQARNTWLHMIAEKLDLRLYHSEVPAFAPRLVQQALYVFCSKSNRRAHGEPCRSGLCVGCVPQFCPVH